ncbi:MAG: hypothetical protein AB7F96_00635 [Beijerinckiaceae bacterium]
MNTNIETAARHLDAGRAAIMEILQRGTMSVEDVLRLRREVFAEGCISRDDAEALFALERSGIANSPEWTAFFVEAITDHAVYQARPTGVVNTPQAEWLIEQVDRTKTITALAALINILAEAHRVPQWLPAAARGRAAAGWPGVNEALEAAREDSLQAA